MAKKSNNISVNAFENAVKSFYEPVTEVIWNGLEVEIKKTLSFEEMVTFVNAVVNNCTADGSYYPEAKDFAIENCIIELYTNITLPSNSAKRYGIIHTSGIVDVILENINKKQFTQIVNSINEKIETILRYNSDVITSRMNEIYSTINDIGDKLGSAMGDISPEEFSKFIKAFDGLSVDEDKIVNAVIESNK